MKNFTKLIGIIAMVAVMALAVSCSKNGGSGGSAAGTVADAAGAIASVTAAPASDFSYRLMRDTELEINKMVTDGVTSGISEGVVITGYTGSGGKVVIPATIEDLPVVMIDSGAFLGETRTAYQPAYEITEVVIPEGVELIGTNAFYSCANLTTVTLPTSLKYIASAAFWNCGELVNLTIPDTASFVLGKGKDPLNYQLFYNRVLIFSGGKLPLKTRARLVELGHMEF